MMWVTFLIRFSCEEALLGMLLEVAASSRCFRRGHKLSSNRNSRHSMGNRSFRQAHRLTGNHSFRRRHKVTANRALSSVPCLPSTCSDHQTPTKSHATFSPVRRARKLSSYHLNTAPIPAASPTPPHAPRTPYRHLQSPYNPRTNSRPTTLNHPPPTPSQQPQHNTSRTASPANKPPTREERSNLSSTTSGSCSAY